MCVCVCVTASRLLTFSAFAIFISFLLHHYCFSSLIYCFFLKVFSYFIITSLVLSSRLQKFCENCENNLFVENIILYIIKKNLFYCQFKIGYPLFFPIRSFFHCTPFEFNMFKILSSCNCLEEILSALHVFESFFPKALFLI